MKIKFLFSFIFCSLVLFSPLPAPEFRSQILPTPPDEPEAAAYDYETVMPECDPIKRFLQPVQFSTTGTDFFIKHTFNHPGYAPEFLPHDFSHIIQFLDNGKQNNLPRIYTKSVCKLFTNKIKEIPYANAYAFDKMLAQLPSLLDHHFTQTTKSSVEPLTETVKDLLYTSFLDQFSFFQEKPDEFFDELSVQITRAAGGSRTDVDEEVSAEQLRYAIIRLLENGLNKIIWSPEDQNEIWPVFKSISEHLAELTERQIIGDMDNLDDLYKSLITRFCYFLQTMGPHLSPEFYAQVKADLQERSLFILQLEEQEDLMESKAQRIARAIFEAEAHAHAHRIGML